MFKFYARLNDKLLKIITFIVGVFLATTVYAGGLTSVQYEVYEQDITGGKKFYVVPKESILILHSDIATPIEYMPKGVAFSYVVGVNGAVSAISKLADGTNRKNIKNVCSSCVVSTGYKLHSADFNNDAFVDILLQGKGNNASFIVSVKATDLSKYADFGTKLDSNTVVINNLASLRGGYVDVITYQSGAQYAYVQSSSGIFSDKIRYVPEEFLAGKLKITPKSTLPVNESNATLVGAINGKHSVSPSGAASYEVPLYTFPGTAGNTPKLFLSYSSQSGNGVAGLGWGLRGLSQIGRCGKTIRSDGVKGGVNLDRNDRFCLDGARLVVVSGSYGENGATYRKEIDDYSIITSVGGSNSQPDYFKVERKSGATTYYGRGYNSQNKQGNKIVSWAISLHKDSSGNPIKYSYVNDAGGHRIDRIDYAYGSTDTSAASSTYIKFNYEDRVDKRTQYLGGIALRFNKRLRKIDVYSHYSTDPLKTYYLAYDQHVGASPSKLTHLYECKGTECLKPLTFEWEKTQYGFNSKQVFQSSTLPSELAISGQPVDINGDGYNDIAYIESDVIVNQVPTIKSVKTICDVNINNSKQFSFTYYANRRYCKKLDPRSVVRPIYVCPPKIVNNNGVLTQEDQSGYLSQLSNTVRPRKIHNFTHYEVSQRADAHKLKNMCKMPLQVFCAEKADQVFTYKIKNICEKNETIYNQVASRKNYLSYAIYDPVGKKFVNKGRYIELNASKPNSWIVRDFNLDGYPDLLRTDTNLSGQWYLDYGSSNGFIKSSTPSIKVLAGINVYAGDVDGDDVLDIFYKSSDKTITYFKSVKFKANNKYQYKIYPVAFSLSINDSSFRHFDTPKFVDINNDGMSDIVGVHHSSIVIYKNLGKGQLDSKFTFNTGVALTNKNTSFVDVNADGLADLVISNASSGKLTTYLNTGSGFVKYTESSLLITKNSDLSWQDYNSDGHLDFIYKSNGSYHVWLYDRFSKGYINSMKLPQLANLGNGSSQFYFDVNGDGNTDSIHFYVDKNGQDVGGRAVTKIKLSHNNGIKTNVIKNINNSLGKIITYEYKPLIDSSVYLKDSNANTIDWNLIDILSSRHVVSRVGITQPLASVFPGHVNSNFTTWYSHHYSGAKYSDLYGYLGFYKTQVVNSTTNEKTVNVYNQRYPLNGKLINSKSFSANKLVSEKNYTWASNKFGVNNNSSYYQLNLKDSAFQYYEPVSGILEKTVLSASLYDNWGNIKTHSKSFIGNQKQFKTTKSYEYSNDLNRRYGLYDAIQEKFEKDNEIINKKIEYSYYSTNKDAMGDHSKSSLKLKTVTTSPNDAALKLITAYQYDDFGNILKETQSAANFQDRYTRSEYDSKGIFVDKIFNSKASEWGKGIPRAISIVNERDVFGSPKKVTDVNGEVKSYTYGALGRQKTIESTTGQKKTLSYSYNNLVTGAAYKVTKKTIGAPTVIEQFDSLNRTIASAVQGFDGTYNWVLKEYNKFGKEAFISNSNKLMQHQYWSKFTYDVYGRLVTSLAPSSDGKIRQSNYAYSANKQTITNALGQVKTIEYNALGKVAKVVDTGGAIVKNTYTPDGNIKSVISQSSDLSHSFSIDNEYNHLDQKIRMIDPDQGTTFYVYTPFGELRDSYQLTSHSAYNNSLAEALSDTTVKYDRISFQYDSLGRKTKRVDYRNSNKINETEWKYDYMAKGMVYHAKMPNQERFYGYDKYGRLSAKLVKNTDQFYVLETINYDGFGRIDSTTDLLGTKSGIKNHYNNAGYVYKLTDLKTSELIHQINDMDTSLRVLNETLSNNSVKSASYDQATGNLLTLQSKLAARDLQDLTYVWDELGNMSSIDDQSAPKGKAINQQQKFCYDNQNRLIKTFYNLSSSCSGLVNAQQDQRYDDFGRLTHKPHVGSYHYTNTNDRPHAVRRTVLSGKTSTYNYDKKGNMLSDSFGRTIEYSIFNKPIKLVYGNAKTEFSYGIDRSRFKRKATDLTTGKSVVTYYYGNTEKIIQPDGSYEVKRYLGNHALWVHAFDKKHKELSVTKKTLYKDALGSVTSVLINNAADNKADYNMLFGPWGERARFYSVQSYISDYFLGHSSVDSLFPTTKGFTGHEMIDSIGLIHMNGRVYNPKLGRFLQADPIIARPINSQNYDRYAYVLNNPLRYTDPTGYVAVDYIEEVHVTGQRGGDLLFNNIGFSMSSRNPYSMLGLSRRISSSNTMTNAEILQLITTSYNEYVSEIDKIKKNQLSNLSQYIENFDAQSYSSGTYGYVPVNYNLSSQDLGNIAQHGWVPPSQRGAGLDSFQEWLGYAGLFPGLGNFADGLNGAIYLGRGDLYNAGFALGAMIPVVGQSITGARLAGNVTKGVANPVPSNLARVVPGNVNPKTLGRTDDVFVTDANALKGLNSKQIADKLTIPQSSSGFKVIEFPSSNVSGIASPINRTNPGFIQGGRTAGGAPEFVIPNGPIPAGATTRVVP